MRLALAVLLALAALPAEGYHSDETLTLLAAKRGKQTKRFSVHEYKKTHLTKHQKHKKVQHSKPSVTTSKVRTSVAHKTERYASVGATLKYLTAEEVRPDGRPGTRERRKIGGGPGYGTAQNYPALWEEGTLVDGVWTPAAPAEDDPDYGADVRPLIKERSETPDWGNWGNWGNKNNQNKETEQERKAREKEERDKLLPETKKHREEREKPVGQKGDGHAKPRSLSRCGFSWDDAAAKVGERCLFDDDCWRPVNATQDGWPESANYSCYDDMPDYQRGDSGECTSRDLAHHPDSWCQQVCGAYVGAWCDPDMCKCVKNSQAWIPSAPIQPPSEHGKASALPPKSDALVKALAKEYDHTPSGLPACTWRPHKGCTNDTQYECFEGSRAGECSGTNPNLTLTPTLT